jgi:hypothetical protein
VVSRNEKVARQSVPNKLHPTEKYDRHVYGYPEKYFERPNSNYYCRQQFANGGNSPLKTTSQKNLSKAVGNMFRMRGTPS